MPKKASQKFDVESKMLSRPTFSLYEIDTRGGYHNPIYALRQARKLYATFLRLNKLLKCSAKSVK